MKKISYSRSGVNYNLLDPVKKMAQMAGLATINNIKGSEVGELSQSRGESAYVMELSDCYFAVAEEGLGTKNLVADEMRKITGRTYYDAISYDTVAAIINDLITVGAKPLTILAYWAVGDSKWWKDIKRAKDLVKGWKKACDESEVTWGGGETPSMNDVVKSNVINLAGCAMGIIKPKKRLITEDKLQHGDAIILLESSGIHANGLSLARKIAQKADKGYETLLPNGNMYGEELLKPTIIYSKLIQDLRKNNIDIHYMSNITGHGWRKLMRARKSFSYVIDNIPKPSGLFSFIQENSGLTTYEMYSIFNMGAGFAVYISKNDIDILLKIVQGHKIKALIAGRVEKGKKQIIIHQLNITYSDRDLNIR